MTKPPIPANEEQRLRALYESKLLDTPIQEGFERITRLAKSIFQVPIVAFTLVDQNRQWFKSIQGLDVCETDREVSFCAHAINQDNLFIVNDATQDERFADNPLVVNSPQIRFYAGCPVRGINQQNIGTLCIIDTSPRDYKESELENLVDLAKLIENEITANRISYEKLALLEELTSVKKVALLDGLTNLLNRKGIEGLLQQKMQQAEEKSEGFGIALIDVDGFKKINDTYGHCVGDKILRQVARRLLVGYRDGDIIGRWGGEEFLVILNVDNKDDLKVAAERARTIVGEKPVKLQDDEINITITTGISWYPPHKGITLTQLISHADKALYYGKNSGRNKVVNIEDAREHYEEKTLGK